MNSHTAAEKTPTEVKLILSFFSCRCPLNYPKPSIGVAKTVIS
jgi:hypothetical protein